MQAFSERHSGCSCYSRCRGGAKGGTEQVRSFVTFPYGRPPLPAWVIWSERPKAPRLQVKDVSICLLYVPLLSSFPAFSVGKVCGAMPEHKNFTAPSSGAPCRVPHWLLTLSSGNPHLHQDHRHSRDDVHVCCYRHPTHVHLNDNILLPIEICVLCRSMKIKIAVQYIMQHLRKITIRLISKQNHSGMEFRRY